MALTRFTFSKSRPHLTNADRRAHKRHPFEHSFRFRPAIKQVSEKTLLAKSKNVSSGGMLFKSVNTLPRKSFVLLELDTAALSAQVKFDRTPPTHEGRMVGKVVRTHLNLQSGLFEIGVQFMTGSKQDLKDLRAALSPADG